MDKQEFMVALCIVLMMLFAVDSIFSYFELLDSSTIYLVGLGGYLLTYLARYRKQ